MLQLASLLAIAGVVYMHPITNTEQSRHSTMVNTLAALKGMMEKTLQMENQEADIENFRAENLAHQGDNQFAHSRINDQSNTESNLQDYSSLNPKDLENQDNNIMLQNIPLSQVDNQAEMASDQDFSPENSIDKIDSQHARFQVNDQEPNSLGFNTENRAQEASYNNMFQQSARFQADGNFKRQSHADENNVFEEPALSQMDDLQANIASDEIADLAFHEFATIQQQSIHDLIDAMKDEQQRVDSNREIADDIVALLQGEDITKLESEEERGASQSFLSTFNSGLQVFVNQMNRMISKYSNVMNCFPRMQAEMQTSDKNDSELVNEVMNRLANIQGQQNRQIRKLFQKIRKFIQKTSSKGQALVKKIRRTLGSLLRRYEVVITCVRRHRG